MQGSWYKAGLNKYGLGCFTISTKRLEALCDISVIRAAEMAPNFL